MVTGEIYFIYKSGEFVCRVVLLQGFNHVETLSMWLVENDYTAELWQSWGFKFKGKKDSGLYKIYNGLWKFNLEEYLENRC